jgi:hypothetical protein
MKHTVTTLRFLLEADDRVRDAERRYHETGSMPDLAVYQAEIRRVGREPFYPGLKELQQFNTYVMRTNEPPVLPREYFEAMYSAIYHILGYSYTRFAYHSIVYEQELSGVMSGHTNAGINARVRFKDKMRIPMLAVSAGEENETSVSTPTLLVFGNHKKQRPSAELSLQGFLSGGSVKRIPLNASALYDPKKMVMMVIKAFNRQN